MLVIKNWDKILGDTFVDGRFLCSNHREKATTISFWFKDLENKIPAGGIWVDINRKPKWSVADNQWLYTLTYPHCKLHYVSANWFSDINNAKATFEDALKEQ